uniref:Uncharacterized protein n=1 Tax=Chenopodium quinoa TaxID=63459 RepID=A0A803ND55_CHEQI
MIDKAKECMQMDSSNSALYQKLQDTFLGDGTCPDRCCRKRTKGIKRGCDDSRDGETCCNPYLLALQLEQFLSSNRYLHQSCGDASVGALGVFMSLVSLPGNQFWERLPLLLVARKRRYKVLEDSHGSYLESVPSSTP